MAIIRKNIGQALDRTSYLLFSSPVLHPLSYEAQPGPFTTMISTQQVVLNKRVIPLILLKIFSENQAIAAEHWHPYELLFSI